jgi:hypothetical protein
VCLYAPSRRAHDHHPPKKIKAPQPEGIKESGAPEKCLISFALQLVYAFMRLYLITAQDFCF